MAIILILKNNKQMNNKFFPVLLKKWYKLYKEIGLISKSALIVISLMTLIGFITLGLGNPYFLIPVFIVISLYEISKRYEL